MTVLEYDCIVAGTAEEQALHRDYESLGERLARRGIDIEATRQDRGIRRGGAVLGRRHWRHPLRRLPRTGELRDNGGIV